MHFTATMISLKFCAYHNPQISDYRVNSWLIVLFKKSVTVTPKSDDEDNIRMDLKEIGINTRSWVDSAQDRNYWKALVNLTLNLWVPQIIALVILNVTWPNIYCVFTYIYSHLIDRDLCESQNVSVKFICALLVHLCLSSGDLFIL